VLILCVLFLAGELSRRGGDPVRALEGAPAAERPAREDGPLEARGMSRDVTLFFASAETGYLKPEQRRLALTEHTSANCRAALEALIAGPREVGGAVLPPAAQVRGVYLAPGGELVVDLSRELQLNLARSASAEGLMAQSLANTLTQQALYVPGGDAVERVRLLIEGAPPGEGFPAHLDASGPLYPNRDWIRVEGG
jgi:hypothetical protein